MKPIATIDAATETEIIEAVAEETSTKDVPNQRSQKAIAAQEQRRQAREARSKQRKSGGSERPKKNPPQKGQKAQNDDDQKPIQSKRTSGDGRTRKRRK